MIARRLAIVAVTTCLFVVTTVLLVRPSPLRGRGSRPRELTVMSRRQPFAPGPRQRVERELERVEREARRLVASRLRPVENLFDRAHRGVPRFAEDALGPIAALAYLADQLPFSGGDHVRGHIAHAFRTHVLDATRLESASRDAVSGLAADLDRLDAELLVRLRLDLPDLPPWTSGQPGQGRPRLTMITTDVTARVASGLKSWMATELSAIAASEILVRVALRAVSAGGLGLVAASGPLSFGAALAAGLAADHLATWAIDRTWNPRGTLIRATEVRLAALHREVLSGTSRTPGLRPGLERMAREHLESRRAILRQVLDTPKSGARP